MIKHSTFNKILREELALAKLVGLSESTKTPREVRVDSVKSGDEMERARDAEARNNATELKRRERKDRQRWR